MPLTQNTTTQLALSLTHRVPSSSRRTTRSRSTTGQAHVFSTASPMFRPSADPGTPYVAAGHYLLGPMDGRPTSSTSTRPCTTRSTRTVSSNQTTVDHVHHRVTKLLENPPTTTLHQARVHTSA
eukprot:4305263-Amphidinium_carterae.1